MHLKPTDQPWATFLKDSTKEHPAGLKWTRLYIHVGSEYGFPLSQYNRLLLSSPVRPNHVGAGGTTPEGARPIPACCSPTTQHQNHNSKLTIIPTLEVRAGQGKVLCNYKALTIVRLLPAKRMQRNSICLCIYNWCQQKSWHFLQSPKYFRFSNCYFLISQLTEN